MRYGCSLEMVNMLSSGPNFIYKQSKRFWVDYFKLISAAGFKGVELPFNPFSSDPMAFETGRCGIPCNAAAIQSKYGSPEEFIAFLNDIGIEEVTGVHINANDAMLELIASGRPKEDYYELLRQMGIDAIAHLKSLKSNGLIVSPTPELGWVKQLFGSELGLFAEKTESILSELAKEASDNGMTVALKAEYWSLYRGKRMAELLQKVNQAAMSPDLAHMAIAGDPVTKVVEAHKDQIGYMHLSDTNFEDNFDNYCRVNAEIPIKGPQKVFCDLGDGRVDILGAVQVLKDNGYDGWIICEQKKTTDIYKGLLKMRWFLDYQIERKLK